MSNKEVIFHVKDSGESVVADEDKVRRTVDNREQKEYAEYLRDEMGFGLTTINTYLGAVTNYRKWKGEVD